MAYNKHNAGTNGAITGGSITVNTSGVSVNLPAYLTTAALSADSSKYAFTGFTTTTIAGAVVAGTHNTDGLLIAVPAYLTTAALSANTSNYAGVGESVGTVAGTDLAMTVNTDGVSVLYPKWITTAALSGDTSKYVQAWELTGNTAGTTSSLQGTKIYFEGGNSITVSGNSNTVKFSVGAYLTTAALSNHSHGNPTLALTNLTGTTASASNGFTLSLSAADPGAAAEANWNHLLGANTAGNTTASGSTIGLSGINLTLSGTNNSIINISAPATSSLVQAGFVSLSANNSTITVSGLPSANIKYLEPRPQTNTSAFVPGAGSWYFAPFVMPGEITGGRINNLVVNTSTAGIAMEVTANSFVTGTMGTKNQSYTHSFWNAIYSQGTGTNSTRLESMWSNTFSFGLSNVVNITSSGAGSSILVSNAWSISYISEIGSNGAYTLNQFNSAVSSTGTGTRMPRGDVSNAASSIRNMLSNSVVWPIGLNTTLSGGNYWMAQMYSSTSASAVTTFNAASALIFSNLNQVYIQGVALESYRNWGSTATTARSGIFPGHGMAYTAVSAVPPQYVNFSSDLSTVAGNNVPYFNFVNQGITK